MADGDADNYLLLETAGYLLLAHGGRIVLGTSGDNWVEQTTASSSWTEEPGGEVT